MENLTASDKTVILLNALDTQIKAMERSEETERQIFQWSTGLLLASFGVVVALSERSDGLSFLVVVKTLASVLIIVPLLLSVFWILRRSKRSAINAEVIERIQKILHMYESNRYGGLSPYPEAWEGTLVNSRLQRKTPLYYASVMILMTACVIASIWLIL